MRSTVCKILPALCLVLLLFRTPGAGAYAPEDPVGQPGMLLAAMSGSGSLTDESVMGDAAADAVRAETGSDFALVPGGALTGNLEPKPQTYGGICSVLAEPETPLAVAQITAAELKSVLEAGVSAIVLDETETIDREASAFGGFPQVSGLSFTYDTSAHAGERVLHIRVNGTELDMADKTVYTLSAPESVFRGAYGYPLLENSPAGSTLAEALADFVSAGTGDSYTGEGRIIAVGCTDYNIVKHFPLGICVIAAMVIWVGARLWKYKYFDRTAR